MDNIFLTFCCPISSLMFLFLANRSGLPCCVSFSSLLQPSLQGSTCCEFRAFSVNLRDGYMGEPSKSVVSLLKWISLGSHRVGFHIMKILLEVQHRPAHICHSNWLISCFNTFSKTNISYQTLTCRPLKTSSLLKLATASKSCASRDSYSNLNWNLWVNYETANMVGEG